MLFFQVINKVEPKQKKNVSDEEQMENWVRTNLGLKIYFVRNHTSISLTDEFFHAFYLFSVFYIKLKL